MFWNSISARGVVALLCGAAIGACGGTTATSPSAPANTTPAIGSCANPGNAGCPVLSNTRGIRISVFANNNGVPIPWSYTLDGLTVSGSGNQETGFTGLTPGDLEVTGQMIGRGTVGFSLGGAASNLPGQLVPNSVQSLDGPGAGVLCNGVNYFLGTAGTLPQSFRFKFTLDSTTTRSSGC